MNLFSRLMNFIGVSRYDGGKGNRKPIGEAWQELSSFDRERMISAARDLFANTGFIRDIVAANDIYSVGDGITAEPATADEEWNLAAADYFERWSKSVCCDCEMTLAEATSIASQRLDIDGEFYVIKTFDGAHIPRLQFLEAQRLDAAYDNPIGNIIQGIRFADNLPAEYYFLSGGERRSVPAANVIHVFIRESFSSVHGLPQIQHAINSVADTQQILRSVVANAKYQQALPLVIKSERAAALGNGELLGDLVPSNPDYTGKALNLLPEEDAKAFQTTSPNESVLNALNILDRRSCGGVLPPDFFDPSKIGGASTRLITSKAARHFGRRQTQLINRFLREIWAFVIANAIRDKRLADNQDFLNVEWNCPKSITVDAGREEATDMKLVESGLKSESAYYAERGINARKEMRRALNDRAAREKTKRELGLIPANENPSP